MDKKQHMECSILSFPFANEGPGERGRKKREARGKVRLGVHLHLCRKQSRVQGLFLKHVWFPLEGLGECGTATLWENPLLWGESLLLQAFLQKSH